MTSYLQTTMLQSPLSDTEAQRIRDLLGLGDLSTRSTISDAQWSGTPLSVQNGGTGASDAAGAAANLGLGALAFRNTLNNAQWSGTPLSIGNGGFGGTTAAAARTNLGLNTFVSAPLVPALDSIVQANHNMGTTPIWYGAFIRCVTAELGYSVGTELAVQPDNGGNPDGNGIQVYVDSTKIYGVIGGNALAIVLHRTSRTMAGVNVANWRVVLKARI